MTGKRLLHCNLENTALDDFIQHVRLSLGFGLNLLRSDEGDYVGILGEGDDKPYTWYFNESGSEPVIVALETEIAPTHRVFSVYLLTCPQELVQ